MKSLGVMQADGILLHTKMKDKIRKDNLWRVRKVAQSKPNGGNLMQAINNLAVSLARYAEAIIDWKKQELKELKLLTMNEGFYPDDCIADSI